MEAGGDPGLFCFTYGRWGLGQAQSPPHPTASRPCHSSIALMAFSPPIVPPARLARRRLEVSHQGRRGVWGGVSEEPSGPAKRAPFSPGGRRVGDEGAQPVGSQPAFASLLSQRPPHPTAARPPSPTRGEGELWRRFGKNSKACKESPLLPWWEKSWDGCSICDKYRRRRSSPPQRTPHPTASRPPSPLTRGEGSLGRRFGKNSKACKEGPLLPWWEKGWG